MLRVIGAAAALVALPTAVVKFPGEIARMVSCRRVGIVAGPGQRPGGPAHGSGDSLVAVRTGTVSTASGLPT